MRDLLVAVFALAIVVLLGLDTYLDYRRIHRPQLNTRFQCVTLVDGRIFCGRADHLGSDHPVLRDAFRVQTETPSASDPPRHTLVRMRDGATGADHLIFPSTAISSVEPVRADSVIGRLITDAGLSH
jgi:hypothetical protein